MTEGPVGIALPEDLEAVRRPLLEWYEAEHRAFPWRETTDPYAILVCEVMSQQTQLERVLDPWRSFLDRWPTVDTLAAVNRSEVVGFWSAHRLGYNTRARYLHEAATMVVDNFDGSFPETPERLQELPGVGPYTASAVASFAFETDVAVVDTNVERVLYRAFDVPDRDDAFASVADALVPSGMSRVWNEAVMELGGTVCEAPPRCDEGPCPWRDRCGAYGSGDFSAPNVPTQAPFDGSRRQFRGRVIRALESAGELPLTSLGPRVRVDYSPDGQHGQDWLRGLLADLADDGLVEVDEAGDEPVARLAS